MATPYTAEEHHFIHRVGWLRAAVLGANDGIVSTASLLIGVASAAVDRSGVLLAGVAGLAAGAMSMAAGEYVSVSSQADTERADLEIERKALEDWPGIELQELADIYVARGVDAETARTVAKQLMARDALGAHARDELGLTEISKARPFQAAISSASSFTAGAILPLLAASLAPMSVATPLIAAVSLVALALLGYASASAGGANKLPAVFRVVFWGAAAMVATGLIGRLFGTIV
ncbi:MAG: VIT family protein [Pseudomonadota bacterium]